jgi:hypothetical protein
MPWPFIDRPVDVAPHAGDFDVGLVDEPPRPHDMATWACRVDEQRREPLPHRYKVT